MAVFLRRWLAASLGLAALCVCGCQPAAMAYFLFGDDGLKPECEVFASPKKEIKVVFLPYVDTDMRNADFLRTDRDLSESLVRLLKKRYEDNKTKIKLIAPGLVESFKDKNPSWHTMSIKEIGEYFHADYVVNLELSNMSLYEQGSKELFRGMAQAAVTVYPRENSGDGPVFRKDFTFHYPTNGPRSVFDANNPIQFRAEFTAYMVKQMARCFGQFPIEDKYPCE